MREPGSITRLVNDLRAGAAPSEASLLPAVYAELCALARERTRRLGVDSEIRTGDLVNEAYLKLFGRASDQPWESRRHFYGSAARAMQQVVVDLVRRVEVRRALAHRIAIPSDTPGRADQTLPIETVLRLLDELEKMDSDAAEVVRMRVFAGLGIEESARVLGLSLRTAQRKWTIGRALARSWLSARMDDR
jgi:RNA polymerase sigma factor (TIGR02999 family)